MATKVCEVLRNHTCDFGKSRFFHKNRKNHSEFGKMRTKIKKSPIFPAPDIQQVAIATFLISFFEKPKKATPHQSWPEIFSENFLPHLLGLFKDMLGTRRVSKRLFCRFCPAGQQASSACYFGAVFVKKPQFLWFLAKTAPKRWKTTTKTAVYDRRRFKWSGFFCTKIKTSTPNA